MADRLDTHRQVEELDVLIISDFTHPYTRTGVTVLVCMHLFEPVAFAVVTDTEIIACLAVRRPLRIAERGVTVFVLRLVAESGTFVLRRGAKIRKKTHICKFLCVFLEVMRVCAFRDS